MKNAVFDLWLRNKKGLLSLEEKEVYSLELEACDYIMHTQVPTRLLVNECGSYNRLFILLLNPDKILELASYCNVNSNAIYFKILYLIQKNKKRKKIHEAAQMRVLKKEGNVIYLK